MFLHINDTLHRVVPRAVILSMGLVTTLFVLANLGYFAVLGEERVLQSEAVAMVRNKENSNKLSYQFFILLDLESL